MSSPSPAADVVVVTGASRGLGAAIASELYEAGAAIAVCSRSMPDTWSARPRAFAGALDVADAEAFRRFLRSVETALGPVCALVNNAGIAEAAPLALTSDEALDAMIRVNVRGQLVAARECIRLMLPRRRGVIVNIGSVAASVGISGLAAYGATKAASAALARGLARELAGSGIRVNTVEPGAVLTGMLASGLRLERGRSARDWCAQDPAPPTSVSTVVRWLLSSDASHVNGQVIRVDGGAWS